MFLLSIDTSGKTGGISLAEGDASAFRLIESALIAGGTFSAQLVPTLAALFQKHGLAARNLDGFVAVSGPGSFTGLRVGLSAVKGLAEVLHKPIAVVSLLEALAVLSGGQGRVVTALDAGREEVYCGTYQVKSLQAVRVAEHLLSRVEFIGKVKAENSSHIVTSDETIAQLGGSAGIHMQRIERPGSGQAAQIGLQKLLAAETVDVEELDANYIRRSDAEIFSPAYPVIGPSTASRDRSRQR